MAIQLLPGGLLGIGTLFLKESPAWLLRRGRDEEALTVLSWMRKLPADHKYIQEEVGMTHAVMEEESQLSAGQRGMGAYVKGAMRQLKVDHIRHRSKSTREERSSADSSYRRVLHVHVPELQRCPDHQLLLSE